MAERAMNMRDDAPKLTGLKKRQQIEVASRAMFIWVAVAAAALSFCAATAQYLFVKWDYNNRVLSAKSKAERTLTNNINNAKKLTEEVNTLVANQDLASVKTNLNDPNIKSILDALPPTFDPAALATSLQQIILAKAGVAVENIGVPEEQPGAAVAPAGSGPQEMRFNFVVSGKYDQIRGMLVDIERTIRPIQIVGINLTGSDANLRATIEAITYYQPAKTVDIKTELQK